MWTLGCSVKFFRVLTVICVALFLLSVYLYDGGTHLDHNAKSYTFADNLISDLGRTRTFDDRDMSQVRWIYFASASLGTLGVFNLTLFTLFRYKRAKSLFFLAVVPSLFLILRIATFAVPWDLYGQEHLLFAVSSFFFSTVMAYIFFFETINNADLKTVSYVFLYLVFSESLFFSSTFFIPVFHEKYPIYFNLYMGLQKITVFSEFVCYWILSQALVRSEKRP